jgi:hypothetical protein
MFREPYYPITKEGVLMNKRYFLEELLQAKPNPKDPVSDLARGILDYKRNQIPTASENTLKTPLLLALYQSGFTGHIAHQEYIPIPAARIKKHPYFKKFRNHFSPQFNNSKFILRIPDFTALSTALQLKWMVYHIWVLHTEDPKI